MATAPVGAAIIAAHFDRAIANVWFKNLIAFKLTAPWTLTPGALEEQLSNRPLLACSGLAERSQGWVPAQGDGALVCAQGKQSLIALGVETKILPSSVVKDVAQERAEAFASRVGFEPGKKQLREIRAQVRDELLPKAFCKRQITRAWINPDDGWIMVDSASHTRAEELTELLRETLGTLAIEPLSTEQSPVSCMSQWLLSGRASDGFVLDQDCEMKSGGDDPSAVRFARHALDGDDVRRHLKEGKSVTQLGLKWNDRVRLILADPGVLKRIRFDAMEQDRDEPDGQQNQSEQFDADFALMTGELSALFSALIRALGGLKG